MKLSKSDALVLHSLLLHSLSRNNSSVVSSRLQDIMMSIENYLFSEVSSDKTDEVSAVDDIENVVENLEEEETIEVDDVLSASVLEDLVSAQVVSPDGQEVDLNFERDESGETVLDALIDEGTVIIENIELIKIVDKTVSLFDGGEWHDFKFVNRVPKLWSRIIKPGLTYEVKETV